MQVGYILREGFSGFRRARLSMMAAIVTISISLLLLSTFAILFINAERIVANLRNKVEIEAFLSDQLSDDEVSQLKTTVAKYEGVREVRYVSKEEAATMKKKLEEAGGTVEIK